MKIIIITGSDVYENRVNLLFDYFKAKGEEVKVYTTDFDHMKKKRRNIVRPEYILVKSKPYKKNISFARIFSHYAFSRCVKKELQNEDADLLWILIPPNSLVKEFTEYKVKHPKVKMVFDVIDMWPETFPLKSIKKLPMIHSWANLRNRHIDIADYVITECDLYQSILKEYVNKTKMRTLYLAKSPYKETSNHLLSNDRLVLCYLGSINNIIDIPTIVKIIKELSLKKLVELHIIGDGEKKDEFIEAAKQAGADVTYHGKIYDLEKKQFIFDKCHFGLNIMKKEVFVGLTMKSMDYFAAGLPIINNIHGDTWSFIDKHNIGVNYEESLSEEKMASASREEVRTFFMETLSEEKFVMEMDQIMNMLNRNRECHE